MNSRWVEVHNTVVNLEIGNIDLGEDLRLLQCSKQFGLGENIAPCKDKKLADAVLAIDVSAIFSLMTWNNDKQEENLQRAVRFGLRAPFVRIVVLEHSCRTDRAQVRSRSQKCQIFAAYPVVVSVASALFGTDQ